MIKIFAVTAAVIILLAFSGVIWIETLGSPTRSNEFSHEHKTYPRGAREPGYFYLSDSQEQIRSALFLFEFGALGLLIGLASWARLRK